MLTSLFTPRCRMKQTSCVLFLAVTGPEVWAVSSHLEANDERTREQMTLWPRGKSRLTEGRHVLGGTHQLRPGRVEMESQPRPKLAKTKSSPSSKSSLPLWKQ
ncbi:uncharacterized protein ACBT44_014017 isoform 1-T2 [Syngnathus typhle]